MKTKNHDLQRCIERLEENTSKGIIDPSVEVYAVNRLRSGSDILEFRNRYVKCMTKFIEKEIKGEKNESHAVQLVNKGYDVPKVAAFFVHDGLMHTLGHIYNQEVLDSWYQVLPYMKKGFPKDMYNKN